MDEKAEIYIWKAHIKRNSAYKHKLTEEKLIITWVTWLPNFKIVSMKNVYDNFKYSFFKKFPLIWHKVNNCS